ncbi:4-methylaminobutanoate oxidase (formaldehyde-forming) [Pelagimonas phthalicica]|uniref:4-methylaminobutanoate oxidase (Formaldehyde-forming) n=1 Tax=Pelagimonas phthalicica TaxID=1037362 RepID=A0A238J6S6_9RHOB|nr:FAD-dependent oxidoreductase [Pelagimonas phthalicica]TDS95401.1 dimethylglycine dehydrogenase [Pelagimonas phthalicica]SMX26075.1 4-methylaminobutanoate oxidase (formaldehyde-forming) [Pelagimonas phthalicica]
MTDTLAQSTLNIQTDDTARGKPLPSHVKCAIIGGGVVGCSILYHLAKFGWKDTILLERNELTSGSSWHAAGQIHTISSDPNISRLQSYTINLYKEIEELSGQSVGLHMTGGFYLASNKTWHDYLKRERSKARYMGLEQEWISPKELAERHPLIDPKHYYAALWDDQDGDLDPSGTTYAFAKAARHYGAQYFTHTPVTGTKMRPDGMWEVTTSRGVVIAEHVVNCGGLWAREVGHMAGLNLPVQPMEHHYLITDRIDEIANYGERLPCGIDYEANIYFRQERDGLLLGTYEPVGVPWKVGGTPQDFGHELLQPNLEHIADRLELGFERIPALAEAGIKDTINGPFTFGPDGNPMIGPVPGMRNYWCAVGVMAGFCQGGGVGLTMAEWMIDGEPSIDVWAMDIARFGDWATPDWGTVKSCENYERRFVMTFPNETLPKGRRQQTTALYDRLVQKGAVMGQAFGLEHVLWFADGPEDAHEDPTFERNRSFDYVAQECAAVQNAVGGIELANFAKHEIKGPGARDWMNKTMAGYVPKPGRMTLTPMLTEKGRLYGDLTIGCLGNEHFMLFGSGAMQDAHSRFFAKTLPEGVTHQNQTGDWHGIGLSGPKSRELLQKITRKDVSAEAMKFRDCCETFVGGVPVILNRISFSGELGYEIYCRPQYLIRLSEAIEEAGADLGFKWYGNRALMSLRLDKGWGAWGLEFRPDFNAVEAGMDAFINWNKDFVGKEATQKFKEDGVARKLVTLVIDTDIDVTLDEAVMKDGKAVGYITSGGYSHRSQKSMALAYIATENCEAGSGLQVEILGELHKAEVLGGPIYDPDGSHMRG